VTPATGSKGGEGLRLSMAISCARFVEVRGEDAIGRMVRKTKQKAVVIKFKVWQGVYEHMALQIPPQQPVPLFLRYLICDGPKVMFFLTTIVIPRERPSIVPARRALDLP
jgi:hypothetical protein